MTVSPNSNVRHRFIVRVALLMVAAGATVGLVGCSGEAVTGYGSYGSYYPYYGSYYPQPVWPWAGPETGFFGFENFDHDHHFHHGFEEHRGFAEADHFHQFHHAFGEHAGGHMFAQAVPHSMHGGMPSTSLPAVAPQPHSRERSNYGGGGH
jgi:hypothetical protein